MIGTATRPDERASFNKKMSEEWYMENIHYWVSIAKGLNDKTLTLENIQAANGVVPESMYHYVLNPLQSDPDVTRNLPGVIRNTDFITPIREKNIGEYLELPNEFTVKVDDPSTMIRKDEEVADKVRPVIEQAIINKINEAGVETGIPSTEGIDIKKVIDETIAGWFDTRADEASKLVRWVNDNNDLRNKRISWFSNWWSTEECYIQVGIQNSEIFYDTINPLEGFPIFNGYEYIEDHEAFVIARTLPIDRIKELYGEDLSKKDLEYLDSILNRFNAGAYDLPAGVYQDIYGRKVFEGGRALDRADVITYGSGQGSGFKSGRNINEYVLYFKTDVQRTILYYFNQLGQAQQRVVANDFEIDEQQGHIKLEKKWISETWKQILLGETYSGIYIKPKVLEVQIYDARGHNKLPIIGKKGLVNGTFINPIPKRIIPNLALHEIITLQIERQMAKYKGTMEIIPQSLLKSDKNQDAKGNMLYKMMDNTIIYDDSEVDFNTVAQGYRLVGDDAASNYIRTLIDYRGIVKAEAWDMANMNDARYGQAANSATVTNNQQNIHNARLGSVLMVNTFNSLLVKLYTMSLEYAKHVYVEGKSGTLFNDDGTISYYNMNSTDLTENRFGIFMTNSILEFNKLKEYKDLAFSASQNGEFGIAMGAIDGTNVSGIRKHINQFIKDKQEYERALEQQKLANDKAISDATIADNQAERAAKTNDIITKEQMITDRAVQVANIKETSDNE